MTGTSSDQKLRTAPLRIRRGENGYFTSDISGVCCASEILSTITESLLRGKVRKIREVFVLQSEKLICFATDIQ